MTEPRPASATGTVAAASDVPDCTHRLSLRVSSHADLVAAARSGQPMFSMLTCRGQCRQRAREAVEALGYEPIEVEW